MAQCTRFEGDPDPLRPSVDGRERRRRRRRVLIAATGLLAAAISAVPFQDAVALITGGEGNKPITDPGWPKGAAAIFNHPGRIAWWEGPPFGGGQWHAECRGDAKALTAVLADFARLEPRNKRVILHDGVGHSFWLNPNGEPAKEAAARIDWAFVVWQAANWEHLRRMPSDFNPTEARDRAHGPPAQVDVYTGGLRWADVTVPKGLDVDDQRLEGHGFTIADGIVLEGKVIDLAMGKPIAARARLERIEPQQTGGYRHEAAARATSDLQGRWVLKNTPAGWHRVVVEAEGYVPRIAGYARFDGQPRWASYDCRLSRAAAVSGRVSDDEGWPLADVEVRIQDVASDVGGRYESPDGYSCRTGADGRFHSDRVPVGRATIWLHKRGYCRPGLGLPITTPAKDLELSMLKSAGVRIVVEFAGARPAGGFIVQMEPEGGSAVGKWGGSGEIDSANRIAFHEIPPGRYVLQGRPNPSSGDKHQAGPVTIDLKGGQTLAVTLRAR
jgi:hypothetical protein